MDEVEDERMRRTGKDFVLWRDERGTKKVNKRCSFFVFLYARI